MAVPEGYGRFRGQNQWPSSWGHSLALHGWVWRASTNTGHFQVCSSCCWPPQELSRKACYHSCYTDSVQESKKFKCFVNFGQQLVTFFLREIKFSRARSCCRPKQCPLLSSIFRSVIGLWVETWHRTKLHVQNWILCKAADLNLFEERAFAQIWIEWHSDFRWLRAKAWKRCQAWLWIYCNQNLQQNLSQMKYDVWKPCSNQPWLDELWFSI